MNVELNVIQGVLKGNTYKFDKYDKISIGRSQDAYFSFPNDQRISRTHCLLEFSSSGCVVCDLNSRNGTFYGLANKEKKIDFKKVSLQELSNNCFLKVGRTVFHIKFEKNEIPLQKKVIENKTIGSFELLRLLGRGAMGGVYLVKHKKLQKSFALKIAHPNISPDEKKINRFLREADHGSKIRHPNIVRYYKAGYAPGFFYIPMEYVDGVDLQQYISKITQNLLLKDILFIVKNILAGMLHLHNQGFIHRDIKPANLMMDFKSKTIKITDFGLAKQFEDCGLSQLTLSNQAMGTPDYMPPEQISNARSADKRADIYSVGATIYFIITRHKLFYGNINEVLYHVCSTQPLPLSHYRSDIPQNLDDIVMKCLEKEADKRFTSIEQVSKNINLIWNEIYG